MKARRAFAVGEVDEVHAEAVREVMVSKAFDVTLLSE
jgi:hypothetical protein